MATMRDLAADGYEDLGTVQLGGTVVAGDPSLLPTALGGGEWWGAAVRPGDWRLLGKPFVRDADLLEELVLVHREHLVRFYDLYDAAEHQATALLPTGRLAVLAGALRTDVDTLHAVATAEADGLPWVLDQGCVLAGIGTHPAQIAAPRGASAELVMIAIGFARAPQARAETVPFVQDHAEDE